MRCIGCLRETPIVEASSYVNLTFGVRRRPQLSLTDVERDALRSAVRVLGPFLAVNWHGAGDKNSGQPHPGLYPGIEMNENHPDAPKPPLNEMQCDLFFCSTDCLRGWLHRLVDGLEGMLQRGEIDGQMNNPPLNEST